jgi:hypothetical protein
MHVDATLPSTAKNKGNVMRTTFNLDDQLLISARHRALEESISLANVIENALRESLAKPRSVHEKIQLITTSGPGVKPGVDLDNGRSLLDIMMDPS